MDRPCFIAIRRLDPRVYKIKINVVHACVRARTNGIEIQPGAHL